MTDDLLILRYLEGDLEGEALREVERRIAEDPAFAGRVDAYRADAEAVAALPHPVVPDGLHEAIMRRARPRRPRRWIAMAAVAGLAFLVGAGAGWLAAPTEPSVQPLAAPAPLPADCPPASASERVAVRFVFVTEGARTVQLVGDWEGWGEQEILLRPTSVPNVLQATVLIEPGEHEYMFLVDGKRWIADPLAERVRPDGFGRVNSVIVI